MSEIDNLTSIKIIFGKKEWNLSVDTYKYIPKYFNPNFGVFDHYLIGRLKQVPEELKKEIIQLNCEHTHGIKVTIVNNRQEIGISGLKQLHFLAAYSSQLDFILVFQNILLSNPTNLLNSVYLVSDKGQIVGIVSPRTPRKLKKKLKKLGSYHGKQIKGFNLNSLLK